MSNDLANPSFPAEVNRVLGPIVIASLVNAVIYGACVVQFWTYYTSKMEKNWRINVLVNWVFILDTFHTIALCYMLWEYTVTNFNNPTYLLTADWPFLITPVVTVSTSLPIQIYLSWRIRIFSGSIRVFVFLVVLAVVQACLGFVCSVMAFLVASISDFQRLIPFVAAWQVATVSCDSGITSLLWWYLNKSRIGGRKSDNVITRVIRSSIEVAVFGAFFCLMDLIVFIAMPHSNFHVIFAFPLGRIYTNTLLLTLNLRQSLREELELQHLPSVLIPVTRDSQRMMGSIQTIPYSVSDAASYGRGNVPSTEGAGVTPSLLEDGRNK